MRIYDFTKAEDKKALKEVFLRHFNRQDIVPFFGSGFTRGCTATRGRVPSVEELKKELIDIIAEIEAYPDAEKCALAQMKLSDISEIFWPILESDTTDQQYRERFDAYIENHFCGVHDLSVEYQQIIDCRWRYLYTLNYDDAIEKVSDELNVIIPYSEQNNRWLRQRRCLYKIHGDALKFLKTGENKYCILSTTQYLQAMNDRSNQAMRQNLETDFSSNNLIFIGCSLLDELDILMAAGTKLAQGKRQNEDTHSYYVRYVDEKTPALSMVQQQQFKNFAITDIIEVKAEEMNAFYSFLARISDEAGRLQRNDNLSEFTGFHFSMQEPTSRKNIDYIFFSSQILPTPGKKEICLPSFFIRRDETRKVVEAIKKTDGYFHVLRGGRLSGKTYVLVDLVREFKARDTYFFPSNKRITDQCFERLLSIKDALLIFDEHSLTIEQIGKITSEYKGKIKSNRIRIVTAVDRSTGMFTRHYFDQFPEMVGFVKIYSLPSGLNEGEIKRFNDEFGKLGLLDYEPEWSFLDFMLKVDDDSTQKHGVRLPNINIINDIESLKALVLFANQGAVSVSQGNIMDITETLYKLCKTADVAIQKDYLLEAELDSSVHDSFCFVANSKYWVYKCLSAYAKNQEHYAVIANAYYEIVQTIQNQFDKHSGQKYYQAVKPYCFFDTIQFIFFADPEQTGSLFLPEVIYEKLLPLFKDDFQFLHQKAKCLLWNSKRKKSTKERAEMLNEALQQIKRASRLAEKYAPANLEFTLYHMMVTRTLILLNNWRYCQSQFNEIELAEQFSLLLKTFCEMVQQMQEWGNDSELGDRDMKDINWFVSQLGVPEVIERMLKEDRKKAGDILTLWCQRS